MFSYTDDAIVTSSPSGRHLSTVIRHPAGMPDDQWRKHADQVCQVLNELDSKAKANSLSLHLQTVGRVYRTRPCLYDLADPHGPRLAELIDSGYLAALERPFGPTWPFEDQMPLATEPTPATARIAELEKQLDEATTKLCAAQMLLEKPVEIDRQTAHQVYYASVGATVPFNNRTFKRVE